MVDDDLWWLWCGTECSGRFIGPHLSAEAAQADAEIATGCGHDHIVFRMTLRQMAAKLPRKIRWWSDGIYDPRPTPARRLILRAAYPLESLEAHPPLFNALLELKETTCV